MNESHCTQKRIVVITGAGRGIGLATAKKFLGSGDVLVLNDVAITSELQEIVNASGGMAGAFDVRDREQINDFVIRAVRNYGHIDVLITNAGILRASPSHQVDWEEWEEVISINLSGSWSFIRAVLPHMLKRRSGRILTVSSELGLIGYPDYAAYCASKGGIIALTKALAKELAPSGILVNSVAPGPTETQLLMNSPEFNDEVRNQLPLGRFGSPDEIAAAIHFMSGCDASYFVGQVISPNGGSAI